MRYLKDFLKAYMDLQLEAEVAPWIYSGAVEV
jgi:hypothetical protein